MKGSESSLRAALRSAYAFGDADPDPATVQRIVASVQRSSRRAPLPAWAPALVAAGAAIAAALAIILMLLSSPRASVPATHPSTPPSPVPQPSWSVIQVKPSSLGIGVGQGRFTFNAHDLPANARITFTVQDGSRTVEILTTTTDAQGNAQGAAALPAFITGPSADFTICVTVPEASTVAGWKGTVCMVQSVPVPTSSAPTHTP